MDKNLAWKVIFIIVLTALAVWTLIPPSQTLKPGIDLAGGTSLIYEINTQGLDQADKDKLSERMITILRRRIDPANIQNLIWRPQGNTRFEIQMPLSSAEARVKRDQYEQVLENLLAENVNPSTVMRALEKPGDQRDAIFNKIAGNSETRRQILDELAGAYDQRKELQQQRNQLSSDIEKMESNLDNANLDQLRQKVRELNDPNAGGIEAAVNSIITDEDKIASAVEYAQKYLQWINVIDELTDPETGKNIQYEQAHAKLDQLNLSKDQIETILAMPSDSSSRAKAIEKLKADFPERQEQIASAATAFDAYRPFRGRLDDAKDLQLMLKGAGILEFRILPTVNHPKVEGDLLESYLERLKTKGPKYASDEKYIWVEIEKADEWHATDKERNPSVVGQFGDKYYVLASSRENEAMLHTGGQDWKLVNARPGQDSQGRRAIDFALDVRGGKIFGKLTAENIGRPLAIILDDMAISAPNIDSRITTNGQITGSYTTEQAMDMVNKLNAGSLPARLIEQPISIKTIGPSIGADNRDKGIKAGIIGLIVVVLVMAVYYTLSGVIADAALLLNILLVLAIMALVRATFTLPGIAGLILTIGMSVDANVLIFERIREEQKKGSSLRIAIKNGYQRALGTILDANLTTFITAAILFWVASEDIKGFAIVLMLGIASSMFTALFATRVAFDLLLSWRVIKDHLFMLKLIGQPKVNWMKLRPIFLTISLILMVGGLSVFFTRDQAVNNKYDIEFTGGTAAQVNLTEPLTRQQVEDRIHQQGLQMDNPAIAAANVYSIGETGKQFEINTIATNVTSVTVTFPEETPTVQQATQSIKKAEQNFRSKLRNLQVEPAADANSLVVTTSQTNKSVVSDILSQAFKDAAITEPVVDEVVNDAIINAFDDILQIRRNLEPQIASAEKITEQIVDTHPELAEFIGGVMITARTEKHVAAAEIENRLNDLRFKPDTAALNWYQYTIFTPQVTVPEPNQLLNEWVYVSSHPEAGFRQFTDDEWGQFVDNEKGKVLAAAQLETSLPRVTQIDPSVGAEAKTRALIAIVLSLFAIVTYIWVRFGNARYGLAAIAALVHDVCIALGAVTACTYIAEKPIGNALLLQDFKINLAMIAAFLTIIGYSLNDTIVVFDRIRENRKRSGLTAQIINDSINQTLSRTIMTSFTTFVVVITMYIFGGTGLRGFTFAIGLGIAVGTYSSIAIAAPILLLGKDKSQKAKGKS
ncbi:MAG: protein translocase subunit SecD [Phycisphaerae bacterium]|nr:protein translocase subunit SecD [Phycisphaerae bacterium]